MQIKSVVAGAAIALAASVGSASAADPFSTLDGVSAQPMTTFELDQVRATEILLTIPGDQQSNVLIEGFVPLLTSPVSRVIAVPPEPDTGVCLP